MSIATRGRNLRHYADLVRLLAKYGRSDVIKELGGDVDGLGVINDEAEANGDTKADEFARDLEARGPTYIKLGQLLSTRADLLPAAYTQALTRLQDDVDPLPLSTILEVFESELGVTPSTAFASFNEEPLASASLGQVHRAVLRSGREVVVKVQRPGVREQIAEDMDALGDLARFVDAHTTIGRRFGFAELLREFESTLADELDYSREASNLRRLAEIVAPYKRLVVPLPVDDFTTRRILTMDYLAGRKITSIGPLGRMELDGGPLAEELFRAYLDQILVAGFFHADPHPGNIALTDDGRVALLDLGMVGRVSPTLQDSLVKLLMAVGGGRGDDAARITMAIGRPLEHFDEAAFCKGATDLVDRNHDLGVSDLDAGTLVMQLSRMSGETGLRLPAELALLGKALLNLDQVSRTLDPDFVPSKIIVDHATSIMQSKVQPSRERLFEAALEAREFMEQLPRRVNQLMDAAANGELSVKVDAIDEAALIGGLEKIANRVTMGLVLAALIVGAAMMARVETSSRLFGYPSVAIVSFLAAAFAALCLVVSIVRRDRADSHPRRRP